MIWLLLRPLPPLSRQQLVSLSQSSCVPSVKLIDGREGGDGVGEEPYHTTASKPWPSINHSILSGLQFLAPSSSWARVRDVRGQRGEVDLRADIRGRLRSKQKKIMLSNSLRLQQTENSAL
jgi:hypothetical protein